MDNFPQSSSGQSPVKRSPRNVKRLGYIVRAFPLLYQFAGVGDLLRG